MVSELYHLLENYLKFLQVGEDVVAELQKAMEKQGVDMRVSALVSSLIWSDYSQGCSEEKTQHWGHIMTLRVYGADQ
jgi:hypothetical protein